MRFLLLVLLCLFSDLLQAQVAGRNDQIQTLHGMKGTGYWGHAPNAPQLKYRSQVFDQEEIPESFDWRSTGLLPPIKDQASCGACYAFGITRVFESVLAIFGNKKGMNLSEQELMSCEKKYAFGCSGGYSEAAEYTVHGMGLETSWPYTARDARCKSIPSAAKSVSYTLVGEQGRAPTIAEIKSALLLHGPLYVTVSAGGAGWSGSGKFGCRNRSTNHIVVITGYQKKGWEVDNSWGSSWQDKGHAVIPYGCDRIADEAGFITVEKEFDSESN